MMKTNPIISPSFFYWASVADLLKFFSLIGAFLLLGIVIYAFLCYLDSGDEDAKKFFIKSISIFLLMFLLAIFIPSKQTLIEMEVAKHVTVNNLKQTKQEVIKFIQDIAKFINNGGI